MKYHPLSSRHHNSALIRIKSRYDSISRGQVRVQSGKSSIKFIAREEGAYISAIFLRSPFFRQISLRFGCFKGRNTTNISVAHIIHRYVSISHFIIERMKYRFKLSGFEYTRYKIFYINDYYIFSIPIFFILIFNFLTPYLSIFYLYYNTSQESRSFHFYRNTLLRTIVHIALIVR